MHGLDVSTSELADIASTLISRSTPVVVIGGQLDKIVAAFTDGCVVAKMAEIVAHPEWLDQPLTIVVSDFNDAFDSEGWMKTDSRDFVALLLSSYDAAIIAPLGVQAQPGFMLDRVVKLTMH